MTRIIPRDLIKHLEWTPGQEEPPRPPENPVPVPLPPRQNEIYSIDNILSGQSFYDNSLPVALQQALDYATADGIIVTMPELIAAKVQADNSHAFWNNWHTVHTEENIGIDKNGKFYRRNDPVLVLVNGGGILSPERIKQAYDEGLASGSAKYRDEEFDDLLNGRLPNGDSINLYHFEELREGVSNLPHRFGVVMPYGMVQNTNSGYHKKREFLDNPLVIARAGGLEHLEAYFDKAKDSDGDVGNYHPFNGRGTWTPQGRVLFLNNNFDGLFRYIGLSGYGRFVGVAPEARGARSGGVT